MNLRVHTVCQSAFQMMGLLLHSLLHRESQRQIQTQVMHAHVVRYLKHSLSAFHIQGLRCSDLLRCWEELIKTL